METEIIESCEKAVLDLLMKEDPLTIIDEYDEYDAELATVQYCLFASCIVESLKEEDYSLVSNKFIRIFENSAEEELSGAFVAKFVVSLKEIKENLSGV